VTPIIENKITNVTKSLSQQNDFYEKNFATLEINCNCDNSFNTLTDSHLRWQCHL
jgi:hypothetical protein